MFLCLQRKVYLSTDKSTAVFPIVLENEEPVYLCLCSSFDDSIVDYGRRLLGCPDRQGKGNILERKHSEKNRRTERTYRIGPLPITKNAHFSKTFLVKMRFVCIRVKKKSFLCYLIASHLASL